MKVSELLRRVNKIIDDSLDAIDVIDWFNQCNESLNSVTYIPTVFTVTKSEVGLFPMPSDYNGELKILSPDNIETFDVYDDVIHFDAEANVGSIKVTYNRFLKPITNNPDEVPELNERFHSIYVAYAAMQAMHPEEEPERYAQYAQDYMRLRNEVQKYMGKKRPKPATWRVVR